MPAAKSESGCSTGVDVTPLIMQQDGKITKGVPFNHGVIFCGWVCDGVGRVKLAKSGCYSASTMACQFCGITGKRCVGFMRQLGYTEAITPLIGKCHGKPVRMGVRDKERLYSPEEQEERALETRRAAVR